ncbi:MAG: hypothetical protein WD512_10965 [Candidatus Paceibacterota bacterium]
MSDESIQHEYEKLQNFTNMLHEKRNLLVALAHLNRKKESLLKEIQDLTKELGLGLREEEVEASFKEEATTKGSSSKEEVLKKKFSFRVAVSKD